MRLGGTETIKVDVRILAASNEDLTGMVREGRFREDLFHRLNVISLRLPPLRDRKEDVPLLVEKFLERYRTENSKPPRLFTNSAMKLMMDYEWPGNVRELENVVERAVVLSTQETMDVDLLPESVRTREIVKGVRLQLAEFLPAIPGDGVTRSGNPSHSLFQIMEEVERRVIVDMLERTNWNQTEAAERFQIPLSTLNQKIKRLGIETRRRSASPIQHAAVPATVIGTLHTVPPASLFTLSFEGPAYDDHNPRHHARSPTVEAFAVGFSSRHFFLTMSSRTPSGVRGLQFSFRSIPSPPTSSTPAASTP